MTRSADTSRHITEIGTDRQTKCPVQKSAKNLPNIQNKLRRMTKKKCAHLNKNFYKQLFTLSLIKFNNKLPIIQFGQFYFLFPGMATKHL